jgi:hypothetical protein
MLMLAGATMVVLLGRRGGSEWPSTTLVSMRHKLCTQGRRRLILSLACERCPPTLKDPHALVEGPVGMFIQHFAGRWVHG